MSFEILEITSASAVIKKTLSELNGILIREAAAALAECTAWIVPPKVREELAKLDRVIEDRGKKHPAIELSRTMLKGNRQEIPMIEGEYSSAGKLLGSVTTLLQKAVDGQRRLFIIAVSDDLFNTLLKSASDPLCAVVPAITFSGRSGAVLNLKERIPEPLPLKEAFIGNSTEAVAVRQLILVAAQVDNTVLITGDTGTGKEIVARQIHENSPRKDKPFRAVNCGAFPHDLLESELFGHVRGAFTGALTSNEGLWLSADGGTLFLDEIGELTPAHQAKLLRVLQDNRIRKVGGQTEVSVNARVICATNRDLFTMVQAGQFRKDLYYRLRDFLIHTPSLREHPDDIPPLARFFWRKITADETTLLPDEIITLLQRYSWPGNVRELRMILSHLFGLFRTVQHLDVRHLKAVFEMQGLHLQSESKGSTTAAETRPGGFSSFMNLRRVYEIIRAVEHYLSPLLNGEGLNSDQIPQISTDIANLLNELDIHIPIPCDFSPNTYEKISHLRARLEYFLSECEQNSAHAVDYLRDGTRRIIEETIAEIFAEIDGTLADSL